MKRENNGSKQFAIQFIFVMLLFLTIVILSVMIITLGRNVYVSINQDRADNYQQRVSLSYIANKIRQGDKIGGVDIREFNDESCIVIKEVYDESIYETWIYYYEGYLYEFFTDESTMFDATDGMKILEVDSFLAEKIGENMIKVSVTDNNKNKTELVLSMNSIHK